MMNNTQNLLRAHDEHKRFTLNAGLRYSLIRMGKDGGIVSMTSFPTLRELVNRMSSFLRGVMTFSDVYAAYGVYSYHLIDSREAIDAALTDGWLLHLENDTNGNGFVVLQYKGYSEEA